MPGLGLSIDLRLYPSATRAALDAAIASGQPYVTFVLLKPEALQRTMQLAEQHWSKKERQDEGLEKYDPAATADHSLFSGGQFRSGPLEAALRALGGVPEGDAKSSSSRRVPVYPVIDDLSLVHSIGVAAEVKIIGARVDAPRLVGVVHRRVQLLGTETSPIDGTVPPHIEAELNKVVEEAKAKEQKQEESTTPEETPTTTPTAESKSVDAVAPITESTATPSISTASSPLSSSSSSPLPPLSRLRVRVKHLEDPRVGSNVELPTDGTDAETAAAASASTSADSSTEMDLFEKALVKEINQTIAALSQEDAISKRLKHIAHSVRTLSSFSVNPGRMADLAAHISNASESELQEVLDLISIKDRLQQVLWIWKKEQEDIRIQKEVQKHMRERSERLHAKHALREEKKAIEELMGKLQLEQLKRDEEEARKAGKPLPTRAPPRGNDKEAIRQRFLARIGPESGKVVPVEVRKVIDEELSKLSQMEPEASEYQMTRNYVDWLTILPWGVHSEEKFDIDFAEEVLNRDHHGLDDVKQRIYEFIASGVLLNKIPPGKIICLVGPPGVGKTSIGKSIAHSLQREFYRFSVGGMDDVSEIKGHRRTYVGSMPGKLVQSLKRVNTSNPVILIDEIDKLGRGGMRGDPSSALLEVLDPEQNNAFMDQYLDVPVDLSKVLFICTANDRDLIPGPLADRMDFIELSGYLATEKVAIASQYLEPAIRERTGVTKDQLEITPEALFHLIRWYCREAGVRSLQKYLEKIYRKVALKMAREAKRIEKEENKTTTPNVFSKVTLTPSNLSEYAGPPNFISDKLYEVNPIGVATGLAYTSHGGAVLFIESVVADVTHAAALASQIPRAEAIREEIEDDYEDERDESSITHPSDTDANPANDDNNPTKFHYGGRGELFCTGSLGNVMKESSSIAYTVAKRILAQRTSINSIHRHFFDHHRIHLHFPSGAIPKDGPSAGIAMVTSLISLAIQTEPIVGHAMTGELTLTGKVLPIGGVKEKLMAAKHAGINLIVLPEGNRKDVDELKPYVIEGLDIKYAKHYDDVFSVIFPNFQDTLRQPTTPAHHLPTYNRRAEIHA